jgi:methyltransferase (TIGR00027 family)
MYRQWARYRDAVAATGGSAPRLPEGVAGTGYSIACSRAAESRREDRLFEDSFAALFEAAGPGAAATYNLEGHTEAEILDLIAFGAVTSFAFAVRTRFFDEFLLEASATCPQVVLVAAGLDARAFRLDWPSSTRLYELDVPPVFAFKEEVLAASNPPSTCARTVVGVDLADDWAPTLLETGFDPDLPTAWLAEGLMLYLTTTQAESLISTIGDLAAPASQLAFEHGPYGDEELLRRVTATRALAPAAATWHRGFDGEPAAWLHEHGWEAIVRDIADIGADLGRPAPPHVVVDLITAIRR